MRWSGADANNLAKVLCRRENKKLQTTYRKTFKRAFIEQELLAVRYSIGR